MSTDRIEKRIELKAPLARVWKAITDYREFGQWFRVDLESPFEVGKVTSGRVTYPGYEHLAFDVSVKALEPMTYFAFTWPADMAESPDDTPSDVETLVEFRLEATENGTRLTLTESGFDRLPADRRAVAFRRNEGGWTEQMENIRKHVGS